MRKLFILIVIALNFTTAGAQWSHDPSVNTPVCTATGKQIDLRIMEDNKGGAYIAWKDYRTGVPDIYIQRVNKYGVPLWTIDGVGLCTNPSDQSTPFITTDKNGGAIVAWSDWRSGIERDLYAQRVDSNGVIQWTVDGVVVAAKSNREHNEKITTDEMGGAIIVWEQQGGTGLWDVWAQRIDANGNPVWTVGGIPMTTAAGNRINGRVKSDGKGGAYITWQDYRSGNYDIYAQHVSSTGTLLWGPSGLLVCNAADAQTTPKIDADKNGNGAYICWVDKRNGLNYDLYAQKVDSTGALSWATNGIPVVAMIGNQSAHDIQVSPILNDMIVTWKDKRSNIDYDIYAQKISPSGVPQWTANGVVVCNAQYDQVNPNLVNDYAGGGIIVWQDSSSSTWNVKAQRVDGNGIMKWTANGENIGIAAGDQTSPKNCTDDNHGSIFAFQDKRFGQYDIYAHHLYSDGTTTMSNDEINFTISTNVSPNPFTNTFSVSVYDQNEFNVSVLDISGKNVMNAFTFTEENITNGKLLRFKSSDELQTGIYFVHVYTGQNSAVVKLIKE